MSSVLYTPLSHQGVFIRKDLLKNRPYKENYRIVSDWIFSLETLVFDNPRYQHIDFDIAVYNTEGVSSNDKARINETELFLSSFMSAQTVLEISSVPSEIYTLFRQIPDSYKFKTICVRIIKFLFNIYIFLKPKALHKCDLPCIYINNTAVTDSEKIRFNNL